MITNTVSFDVWDKEDELKLLSAILECGYGNWKEISLRLQDRSPKQCELHYLSKFVLEPDDELLATGSFSNVRESDSLCSNNCHLTVSDSKFKRPHSLSCITEREDLLKNIEREEIESKLNGCSKSVEYKLPSSLLNEDSDTKPIQKSKPLYYSSVACPGYSAERSEFSVEYDDKAEGVLASMCFPEREELVFGDEEEKTLFQDLQVALLDSYNFRLNERFRRKNIIRNHGLIDRRKTYSMFQRYANYCGKQNLTAVLKVIQFMKTGPELDLLLERLKYQTELRIQLNTMINYRSLGIRYLDSVSTYEKLNKKRLQYRRELAANFIPLSIDSLGIRTSRRSSAPLALHNLPGFTLLDDEEKDLCSIARIVPETYYGFKKLLIQECKKNNGLKLAQARHLIKIDVNKTRKMYDHLLSKGLIWLPA